MEIGTYFYSLSGATEAYGRQHKFPLAPNIPVEEFIRQAVRGYIDILEYINFKEIQGPFPKDPDILPTYTVVYRDQKKLDRFYFNIEEDSIIIERLSFKNDSNHLFYINIINTLSKIIRGKYPDIKHHPILRGSVTDTALRNVLSGSFYGLSDTSLQKIFTAANKNRYAKKVSDDTLLLCVYVLNQIILVGYNGSTTHPSILSEDDLINKLHILEPSLKERCLKSIFEMAVKTSEQKQSIG